jgi:hypothetical protein
MRHPSQDWAMPGDTTLFQENVKNCGNFRGIGGIVAGWSVRQSKFWPSFRPSEQIDPAFAAEAAASAE